MAKVICYNNKSSGGHMKKKLFILMTIVLLTGCSPVSKMNYDDIVVNSLRTQYKYFNVYREGYKYYLPKGLRVIDNIDSNDIITDNKYKYYLYVDRISYYNKIDNDYVKVKNAYYSKSYSYNDKTGYLEINNLQNDKYLIEIMYNYAKIEVIVNKDDIGESISYAINVLSSVQYNNKVIANLTIKKKAEFKEEEYDIFSTINSDSNVLKFKEDYSEDDYNDIPDTDIID